MFLYIREKFHPLWRLRQFSWYRTFQNRMDFPVILKKGSIGFYVRFLRDFSLLTVGKNLEIETHRIFEKIILHFSISHVFDVGANVGTFSWHALNLKPKLKIFLFEPDKLNIKLLKKTIRHNKLTNVNLWEGVVTDRSGEVEFLVDAASGATGSIATGTFHLNSLQEEYGMSKKITVPSTCLDDYMMPISSEIPSVIIKIDVEGAEKQVINGALNFIKKFRPFVIIESFDKNNLDRLIDEHYISYSLPENCNYLLIPQEMEPSLKSSKIL